MTIQEALKELAEEVKSEIMSRVWEEGVNPRTGTNTLIYSDLIKDMKVEPTDNGIVLSIADYWTYVAVGWRRTGKFPGTFNRFVENLNKWVRKKNIHFGNLTQNQIVWIVLDKIWKGGIMPRPFMIFDPEGDLTKMLPDLEAYIDAWFDNLFQAIITELDKKFT